MKKIFVMFLVWLGGTVTVTPTVWAGYDTNSATIVSWVAIIGGTNTLVSRVYYPTWTNKVDMEVSTDLASWRPTVGGDWVQMAKARPADPENPDLKVKEWYFKLHDTPSCFYRVKPPPPPAPALKAAPTVSVVLYPFIKGKASRRAPILQGPSTRSRASQSDASLTGGPQLLTKLNTEKY